MSLAALTINDLNTLRDSLSNDQRELRARLTFEINRRSTVVRPL